MSSDCWVFRAEFGLTKFPKSLVKVHNEAEVWSKKVNVGEKRVAKKGLKMQGYVT